MEIYNDSKVIPESEVRRIINDLEEHDLFDVAAEWREFLRSAKSTLLTDRLTGRMTQVFDPQGYGWYAKENNEAKRVSEESSERAE